MLGHVHIPQRAGLVGLFLFGFALGFLGYAPLSARAQESLAGDTGAAAQASSQSSDQLASQINDLKQQIAQLQTQLNATTQQKQTLQTAVNGLKLNIQKLTASITLTNAQITQTNRALTTIAGSISTTTTAVSQAQAAIAESMRQLQELDQEPLALVLFGGGTLSTLFDQENALQSIRDDLGNKTTELNSLKTTLVKSQTTTQQKKAQLVALQANLNQQKQGLAIAQQSQTQLLQQTKDQESLYQQQIAQKQAQEQQFEQQLLNAGSQLNLTVNPLNLPPAGPILSWPVDNTAITQSFGTTAFSTSNPQVYNGHGHDGIDLRASPGTPVHAALAGVVVGEGNTDLTCPGASFGKWIFIRHDNGLSTMYAHLSKILVSEGQQVSTGDLIAYSDTTGYAIGPHLHFGVYATAGTVIEQLPTAVKCKLVIPVATLSAYLNPLSYLPPLP